MSAEILPFKKDMHAELQKLTIIGGQPKVEELLERHEKIRLLLVEAMQEAEVGLRAWKYLDPITWNYDYFHRVCADANVNPKTVQAFNDQRDNWKRYAEMRKMIANGW